MDAPITALLTNLATNPSLASRAATAAQPGQAPIQGTIRTSVRFWIGRVCMLIHQPGYVRRIVTDSIALASFKDGSIKDIFVLCAWFNHLTNDYRASTQYCFITHEAERAKAVAAVTALCEKSLTLVENNAHALPPIELLSAVSGCSSNTVADPGLL